MTRRRIRAIGLICALVGALCLFAGVFQVVSGQQGALPIIAMGSTLAGVGWMCLATIRRPRKKAPRSADRYIALGLLGGLTGAIGCAGYNSYQQPVVPGSSGIHWISPGLELASLAFLAVACISFALVIARAPREALKNPDKPVENWSDAAKEAMPQVAGSTVAVILMQIFLRERLPAWMLLAYPCLAAGIMIPTIRYRHLLRTRRKEST